MQSYQSDRARQHAEGRDEQQRIVSEAVAKMRPLTRRVNWRLNPVTGKMVEVR